MPVLKNPKHERFVQALAIGRSQSEAYAEAGYRPSEPHASRLASSGKVQARLDEILSKAAEKAGVTVEKIIAELAKIGFADIRKAVEWHGTLVQESDNPDGGDVLVIKNIFSNHVRLIDSTDVDADTAAAIAEVRQSPTGGLSIKLHDKQAALVNLGKHVGMFKDRIEHSGPGGGPIQTEARGDATPEQVMDGLREIFADLRSEPSAKDPGASNRVVRKGVAGSGGKKPGTSQAS